MLWHAVSLQDGHEELERSGVMNWMGRGYCIKDAYMHFLNLGLELSDAQSAAWYVYTEV